MTNMKPSFGYQNILVVLLALALAQFACGLGARPSSSGSQDTPSSGERASNPTLAETPSPVATAIESTGTALVTRTPSFDWGGPWEMYFSQPKDSDSVIINQSGNAISGTLSDPNNAITITGTLTADKHGVSGTWKSETFGTSGTFQWRFVPGNPDQFVGSATGDYFVGTVGWCGFRSGASKPDPCLWP
jgi:hypothetical protein